MTPKVRIEIDESAEDIRPNAQNCRVTLYVTGSNSFGEVQIV